MADITNTMNSSPTTIASSGQIISSESPESVILSPEVREAMDFIFPKSSTQLLSRGLAFEDDQFLGVKKSKANSHPITATALTSHVHAIDLSCSISSAYTTTTTTNTVLTTSAEPVTSTYGNRSSVVSLFPFVTTYCPPVIPPVYKNQDEGKDSEVRSKNRPIDLSGEIQANITSKSDFEVIRPSHSVEDESLGKTSTSANSVDLSSRDDSDSEDMRRPFVSIAREKKKQKKRKKVESNSLLCEVNARSDTLLKSSSQYGIERGALSTGPLDNSAASLNYLASNIQQQMQHSNNHFVSYNNFITKNHSNLNSEDYCHHQNRILENGSLINDVYKNSGIIAEHVSNISLSSTKENVQIAERRKSKQKLPKVKRRHFHMEKHKDKIRNAFLPCFVVVKRMNTPDYDNLVIDLCVFDSVLPLSVRLKHLSTLCDKGFVACKKKKIVEELMYKNIFEETVLLEASEDECESSRGKRSLRKRAKNISYVEPSEDDILEEFSKKRSRTKHKESSGRSEDGNSGESKKKYKQSLSDSKNVITNSVTSDVNIDNNDKTKETERHISKINEIYMAKITQQNKAKVSKKDGSITSSKEIVVYPPAGFGVKNSYCLKVDGRDTLASRVSEHSKYISYLKDNERNSGLIQPSSSNISVLSHNALLGAFNRHPNPLMMFPSLPLGFAGGLPAKPHTAAAHMSTSIPTAGGETHKNPQYCVVKMDGKDVLLQLVPSSGIGVPSSGIGIPVPMVMPKIPSGPLMPSPSHFFGQQLRPAHSVPISTQAMSTSLTSIVTASKINAASPVLASPLHSMFGMPVISTSSHNASLSALPTMTAAHLTGLTYTASSVKPLDLTTGAYISQNSTSGLSSSAHQLSSINSRISSAAAPQSSVVSTQSSLTAVTSMAAPNTTTVVRNIRVPGPNLRTVAPNQSTSVHSVRIFVPGCSALGTPGRFATIGSIANSSPLTHLTASSALLPQRKHSCDQELSPEQRKAKRRKLEKKYPLPPGVVIKTEPLDTPPIPSSAVTTVSGSRSLLSQNVHLVSATRPGTSIQSIRIISPSVANALSVRNVRGNSNIIYRATSIGGGQTVLFPTSFGQISTTSGTAMTSTSLTTSSSILTSSAASLEPSTIPNTTSASVTSEKHSEISSVPVCAPWLKDPELSSSVHMSAPGSSTDSMATSVLSLQKSVVNSYGSLVTCNTDPSLSTPLYSHCKTSSTTAVIVNSRANDNPELSIAANTSEAATLENLRTGLLELRKIIQVQEARGLKGERMNKLRELLHRKEEQYRELQNLAMLEQTSIAVNGDMTGAIDGGAGVEGYGGSEVDPFCY